MKKIFQILLLLTPLSIWAQKMELVVPTGFPYMPEMYKMTPNGRFFVGADEERLILWEAKSLRQLRTFNVDISKIHDVKISPDGKNVVIFCDGNVQCFDIESGKKLWKVSPESYNYSGSFIENGSKIVVVSQNDGYIISAQTGATITKIKEFGSFEAKAYTLPNNKVVMVGSEFYRIYDPNANKVEPEIKFDKFKKRRAVSEKNAMLFVVSTSESDIQCYDLTTNKIIKTIACDDREPIIGTTQEGDALLVRYLDPNDSKYQISIVKKYALPNFDAKTLKINDIRGSSDGYISGSSTQDVLFTEEGKVMKLSTGQAVGRMQGQLQAYGSAFFTNSNIWSKEQIMGFEFEGSIKNLDFKTGQIHGAIKIKETESTLASTISANGKLWAAYFQDNTIRMYDVESGKMLKSFPIAEKNEKQISRQLFRFSPSGDVIYMHFTDGSFTEFDVKTGIFKSKFKTYDSPYYTFSADGRFAGALNGSSNLWKVGVWNVQTGEKLMDLDHKNEGYHRSFNMSNDGKLVVVIDENVEAIYDVQAKSLIGSKELTSSYGFAKGFWNQDNTKLAITGEGRGVRMVDKNYKQLFETKHNGKGISDILFTQNSNVFFTVEGDQINISETATGKLLGTYYNFKDSKDWLVVTPDGRYDGSPDAFKRLYYVKGVEVVSLDALFEKFYTPGLYGMLINGTPPSPIEDKDNIDNLKPAPKVKIQYEIQNRNLTVDDDIPSYKTTNDKAKLTIKADCPEDGVAEIRLYHNGKLVGSGTRNLVVEDDKIEKNKTQTIDIQLVEGENRFKAVAINTQRTESQPDEIIVIFKSKTPPSVSGGSASEIQLHLVVVGINKYKNPKYNLNYAMADATSFKEAIEKGGTSIFSKTNVVFIGDEKATKEGISAELEKVKTLAKPQDVFIFYYAGHGVLNQIKEFYLVPHDVTQLYGNDEALAQKGLSANQLQQFSKEIKAQKQLFILDACQSAGALETLAAARGAAEEKAIAQLARATGTHWLTASGSEQFASEFTQLGHGTFTYVLLEALSGKADKGGDKKVTVKELDAYLQEVVPELTAKYKGTPQYPASYGFGNDFPIGVVKQ
jgi:WD40 repeat protein